METLSLATGSDPPTRGKAAEAAPDERQVRHWLARGLGLWAEDLEALGDAQPSFYAAAPGGIEVALSRDGLGAYLLVPPAAKAVLDEALAGLRAHGLQATADLDQDLVASQRGWLKIAAGITPVPGQPGRIEWLYADRLQERVSALALGRRTAAMLELFQRVSRGETATQGAVWVVYPGQLVGRGDPEDRGTPGTDVFGRPVAAPLSTADGPLVAGAYICHDEAGQLLAERFGYLCLHEGVLSVVSPLHLSADSLYLHWVVLGPHPHAVKGDLLLPWLEDLGLNQGVVLENLKALLPKVHQAQIPGRHLLAQGQPPVPGKDSRLQVMVEIMPAFVEGQQIRFAPRVKAGEPVARRYLPTPGVAGVDLRGRPLPAPADPYRPLGEGPGVMSEAAGDTELFYATEDGTLKVTETKLSVEPTLIVERDVSFSTGSLSFEGNVYVKGAVKRGFSVRADGDILIEGGIEDGGEVSADQGSVLIGGPVMGRRAKLAAQQDIRVHFVQEATLSAGQDILIGEASSAILRAGGQVVCTRRGDGAGGIIAGGQTWALRRISAWQLGAATGLATVLVVGVNRKEAVRLDHLKRCMEESRKRIVQLLARLGVSRIDAKQIKTLIDAAAEPRRKVLLNYAKQLNQLVRLYQRFQSEYQALDSQIKGAGELEVEVGDRIYPGVTLRLGKTNTTFAALRPGGRFCSSAQDEPVPA
ncbi:MAG: DUF342 domain-containing protein [Candidatus Latescibacteria bacterium]|nr:DUF342 domain-containing protein [Candidatus Latescibacterota bacterium]